MYIMLIMRTTVDIPNELFRRAKAVASLHGTSLKKFITTAIEHELKTSGGLRPKRRRAALPLVPSANPGKIELSGDRVAEILESEDLNVFTRH